MTKLETFSALIPKLPALKVAYIGMGDIQLLEHLDQKLQSVEGSLNAFFYDGCSLELPTMHAIQIAGLDKIFRTSAREYEFLVLNEICEKNTKSELLLKTAFKALENSGTLLVFISAESEIESLLASVGFVAINEIEIEDSVKLISAKKMHGWGHGL